MYKTNSSPSSTSFTDISMFVFFFNDTATTEIYTLSLHDALPISRARALSRCGCRHPGLDLRQPRPLLPGGVGRARSEEHTSELQSRRDLVCRLLLEKKNHIRHIKKLFNQDQQLYLSFPTGPHIML